MPSNTVKAGGSAVVFPGRFPRYLSLTTPARNRATIDDGAYVVFLAGPPYVSEGHVQGAAITDLVGSVRAHAEDWAEHLQYAPSVPAPEVSSSW